MKSQMQNGDSGVTLRCVFKTAAGAVFDVSQATSLVISLKRPDGTSIERAAELLTDGTDGAIVYTLAPGDIDQVGLWRAQGSVGFAGGAVLHSRRVPLYVLANNPAPA